MIKLKSVEYQGILSVGNQPIKVDLSSYNKTLITGTNGAGKSTFVEAICFGLYGKPFRPITKPQLVNTVNKKKLLVTVEFQDNKHAYKVIRGIKPNVFEIYKDDELIPQEAATADYQAMLEKSILQMNINTFKQIAVLGTAGYTPFMLLTAAKRREIVEDLLDIGIFSTMADLNKAEVKKLNEKIAATESDIDKRMNEIRLHVQYQKENKSAVDDDLGKFEVRLSQYKEDLERIKSDISVFGESVEHHQGELDEHDAHVAGLIGELKVRHDELIQSMDRQYKVELEDLKRRFESENSVMQEIHESLLLDFDRETSDVVCQLKKEHTEAREKFETNYADNLPETVSTSDIADLKSNIVTQKKSLESLEENKGFYDHTVDCPTCRQTIPEKFAQEFIDLADKQIKEIKEQLVVDVRALKNANAMNEAHEQYVKNGTVERNKLNEQQRQEMQELESGRASERNAITSQQSKERNETLDLQRTELNTIQSKFNDDKNDVLSSHRSEISKIESENSAARDDILTKLNEATSKLSSSQSSLSMTERQIRDVESDIESVKVRAQAEDRSELIQKLSDELKEIKEDHRIDVESKHCRDIITTLLKDSGVKTMIIQQYIPLINKYINDYLKMMNANYNFVLDGEFNETIKSRGRDDFSYASFSQGEKCRIDLALLFAFRDLVSARTGSMTNLLIMDEVFDSATDTDGVDSINAILSGLNDNVFIISHNEKHEQSMFDKHIKFMKRGNFTKEVE